MDGICYESFLKHAEDLIRISNEICDGWELVECDNRDRCYLRRRVTSPASSDNGVILRWEHQVYHSSSFQVPVLCFNVWKCNGGLLTLDEVWEHCDLSCSSQEEFYSALTQQEHPILLRPFFTIHPCKTAEILNVNGEGCNPIIRYLSAIGPMVNLPLDIRYGTTQLDNATEKVDSKPKNRIHV